nr:hypothetical protein [Tanacetum cinerariifolium]
MTLTFADTHNMVAYLNKSDASKGFNQIIDFLNGIYIAYALTVNPTIYVSCIKQFWNTVAVKQSNDVTMLQALVDKKKVVVTEATIRDALHLDDAEGVDCLPNEEIFTTLARMGYEKPSTKLTFYKAFFLIQWKFLIHTILRSMSAKRTSWNEFSSTIASAVICLSTGVETPLFEGMLVAREPENQGDAEEQGNDDNAVEEPVTAVDDGADFPMSLLQEALDAYVALARRVKHLEHVKVAQDLDIIKLKSRVKKLERATKGRMIDESDKDEGPELMNEKKEKETEEVRVNLDDAQVEGRQADIYHIDMDHATKALSMQEDEPEIQEAVEVVTTAKLIIEVIAAVSETVSAAAVVQADVPAAPVNAATVVTTATPVKVDVPSTRQRRGVFIRYPEEESFAKTPTETKSKDKGKGMSYDDIRPIFEAKFNANMEFLLKSKEQMEEEVSRAIAIVNETPAQKATKRKRLNKEAEDVEELKQHLEIVPDEDDDVYTEATLLARKVPVVDSHIIHVNNKPRYKIIHVDNTHQLYTSFITMLKNFDIDDLETLWSIVKKDGQDNVWKNQRSVHGQALVKS